MGLTINYSLVRERTPEELLKKAEIIANNLGFKIEERSWNKLIINPHDESEWICLHFHKVKNIKPAYKDGKMTDDWSIDGAKLQDIKDPDPEEWFCGGFVKTHYAGFKTHIKVAEFMRYVASYCEKTDINDESDYYEKGYSEKSAEELKIYLDDYNGMLGNLTGQLKDVFGKENVILGSDL